MSSGDFAGCPYCFQLYNVKERAKTIKRRRIENALASTSQLLAEVEPDYGGRIGLDECFMKLKTDYDKLKAIAVELARAIEENKKSSELGYQVYPLEDSILNALTTARKMLGE